jgi:hypothetical protein
LLRAKKRFKTIVNNKDAKQYVFANKSSKKIATSAALEHQLARSWYGLSHEAFEQLPGNPDWARDGELSKADVIAAYRAHRLLEAISNDAQMKRK